MKSPLLYNLFFSFASLLIMNCSFAQSSFIGSTPGDHPIKKWLGIALDEKIDFIRWDLQLGTTGNYSVKVNYGEAQPNTLGFKKGGKYAEAKGSFKITSRQDRNILQLTNENITLSLVQLNDNLLHITTTDGKLMPGNGGWSYTLNRKQPGNDDTPLPVWGKLTQKNRSDIVFDGRTPCKELADNYDIETGNDCIKLKWLLTLKHDSNFRPSTYTLSRTLHRSSIIQGKWNIINIHSGAQIIQLFSEKGDVSVQLLAGDDGVLFFLDKNQRLFTGNKDFSYTLNRRYK